MLLKVNKRILSMFPAGHKSRSEEAFDGSLADVQMINVDCKTASLVAHRLCTTFEALLAMCSSRLMLQESAFSAVTSITWCY